MPLILCSTCRGMRVVRLGDRIYSCPTCKGAGGTPFGVPSVASGNPIVYDIVADGASQAGRHLTGQPPIRPTRN